MQHQQHRSLGRGRTSSLRPAQGHTLRACRPSLLWNQRRSEGITARSAERFEPQVAVVLGTQWGDEGKGKLVDILAQQYDIVARAQASIATWCMGASMSGLWARGCMHGCAAAMR